METPAADAVDDEVTSAPVEGTAGTSVRLELYVAGRTPSAIRAAANLALLCDGSDETCRYEVLDVLEHPGLARAARVVATPTLVRRSPPPARRVFGDLSDLARVREALDLPAPHRASTQHLQEPT